MVSGVMLECFFGVETKNIKVDGVSIGSFMNQVNTAVSKQTYTLAGVLLGPGFLKLGLR